MASILLLLWICLMQERAKGISFVGRYFIYRVEGIRYFMATLFVGPSKLLSNVQNVICVLKWDMTMPEKAISKGKYKNSYVYLPNTILVKRFRKIQETQIVIIFASKCIGWTQGGGGRLYHPPKVFFPPPPSCSCSCSCSAPSLNAGLKHQAGMAACHPTCPHYKYQIKEFFFLFIFFSSLLTRAT